MCSNPVESLAPHRNIKSFVKRAGRITVGQSKVLKAASAEGHVLIPFCQETQRLDTIFSNDNPTIFEIGFGMGDATAHIAKLMPTHNFLACEVHEPGIGALLMRIEAQNLHNLRIVAHDAVEVLQSMLPPARLAGVHIFFPDPWHKKRHHKRRLIQAPFVELLASRLAPNGYIHCATDWEPYAQQMLTVLNGATPMLQNANPEGGFTPKPFYRPLTKFEARGLKLGHGVWDLVFFRRDTENPFANR
jgi:tRNA (guanine-N7-)-methyltransferase